MKRLTQEEFGRLDENAKRAYIYGLYNKKLEYNPPNSENDTINLFPDFETYKLYHGDYDKYKRDQDYIRKINDTIDTLFIDTNFKYNR